jgi:ribosomal protein S1
MTTVFHSTLGQGTVISQDDNNVVVDFNGIEKKMIIKFAKLTNADGTPFGTHAVAQVKFKKSNSQKRLEWERTLTEQQKKDLKFENPDGSFNHKAYNDFLDRREEAKRASHSTFY